MKKILLFPFILFLIVLFFFKPFIIEGKIPVPADTIIGLYHPFRDLYAKEYPRGIPFKNFLITDPVRQQYPWRNLSINLEKNLELPLWNPYSFAGSPLLANFQTGALYPFNILFFFFSFEIAWSILVLLQPLLAGIFLYLYLIHIKISKPASFLGAVAFSFSGFNIAWLEWNTIIHTALWLPLILLSIDKILFQSHSNKFSIFNFQFSIPVWSSILIFSLISSFFAGHLQTFFYLFILYQVYFIARWFQLGKKKNILVLFIILNSLFIIITAIQWIPTLQFILESARDVDQSNWQKAGWFIPWEHVMQFIAPDFFGNPTTLNYWGVWNYAEFSGYIGILPLIMALFALFFRRDKKTIFFGLLVFFSFLFSFPTFFAKLPFILQIPFLSTAQPTRLLFLIDFSLAILAALGFDYFLKQKKNILFPVLIVSIFFLGGWIFILFGTKLFSFVSVENIAITKRNFLLPTIVFTGTSLLLSGYILIKKQKIQLLILFTLFALLMFDLLRFADKFTPFVTKEYLFPKTNTILFLQKNIGNYRIMATDSRILPPNFSVIYKLQSIDGYDPLYIKRYGELISASERGKPDISSPFGFNRIITPQRYDSKIIDLLGVKYILSLSNISSPKLTKVFQEGETRVYENKNVLPRTFFVETVKLMKGNEKDKVIENMFRTNFDIRTMAVAERSIEPEVSTGILPVYTVGKAKIYYYSENQVIVQTENNGYGFLVLTDSYYPTWHVRIDDIETKIYITDYNFRGVFVPQGKHTIKFYNNLF